MTASKLIESVEVERDYGFSGTVAVIEHPTHGRLLIADGYGGEQALMGGAVRWMHGFAVKLQAGDTIESLEEAPWNEHMSLLDAVKQGCDETRPMLDAGGYTIAALARSAGL